MRYLFVFIAAILLIFQCQALAVENAAIKKRENSVTPAPPATGEKPRKNVPKPRPFIPSERIGADQAVAFPVDI